MGTNDPRDRLKNDISAPGSSASTHLNASLAASSYWQWKQTSLLIEQQQRLTGRLLTQLEAITNRSESSKRAIKLADPKTGSYSKPLAATVGFWEEVALLLELDREHVDEPVSHASRDLLLSPISHPTLVFSANQMPLLSQLPNEEAELLLNPVFEPIEIKPPRTIEEKLKGMPPRLILNSPLSANPDEIEILNNRVVGRPVGTYARIFLILFLLDGPIYLLAITTIIGGLHLSGLLDGFIYQLDSWCINMGLDRTRPLSEILVELRARRQPQPPPPRINSRTQEPNSNGENLINRRRMGLINLDSPIVRPAVTLARFSYQLFIALLFSLNPQWEPLQALILTPEVEVQSTSNHFHSNPEFIATANQEISEQEIPDRSNDLNTENDSLKDNHNEPEPSSISDLTPQDYQEQNTSDGI